jgi:nucleoside-diphosphate-sugar epimerase
MPRILIAGCGYVGAAAADLFHARGWELEGWTATSESAQQLAAKPYRVRAVDFTRAEAIAAGERFDAVIHCASSRGGNAADYRRIYLEGAQNLAASFPDSLLLFTSSTSVYAQSGGEWVTELSVAEPATETGRILRETEELVLAADGIVARLSGIYGPGRSALLRKFLAGTASIDPEPRFINQAHRDDIAAALFLLAERGVNRSAAGIYNVSDGNPILQRDAYAWLAAHLQRALPPTAALAGERKRGKSNKRVSSAKLQALGWQATYPTFEAAMTDSILPQLAVCGA